MYRESGPCAGTELLEVLKEAWEAGDIRTFGADLDERIEAVIAKAEGK
jgi:hypothetical protein